MKDAYVLEKWKLFGMMVLTALFGVLVGGQARRWRG
ncbi:hypothetical protein BH23CHL2_BH23CHL2_25180 [soil metagenome]